MTREEAGAQFSAFKLIQGWVWMEVSLFYFALLVQLIMTCCIYYNVNKPEFKQKYYMSLLGMDEKEDQEF